MKGCCSVHAGAKLNSYCYIMIFYKLWAVRRKASPCSVRQKDIFPPDGMLLNCTASVCVFWYLSKSFWTGEDPPWCQQLTRKCSLLHSQYRRAKCTQKGERTNPLALQYCKCNKEHFLVSCWYQGGSSPHQNDLLRYRDRIRSNQENIRIRGKMSFWWTEQGEAFRRTTQSL